MRELYWLNVLSNAHELITGFTIMFSFIVMIILFAYTIISFDQKGKENHRIKVLLVKSIVLLILLTLLSSFLPSKKDLYLIYGVGKTLDYLQSNEDAKELPDNVIKTLNKLAEEYAKEDEK